MDLAGSHLDQHMSLELYISHNFIGFFVTDDDANYLKRLALQYVKEVSGSSKYNSLHTKKNYFFFINTKDCCSAVLLS